MSNSPSQVAGSDLDSLVRDLASLGVRPSGLLFVHSSFRSLGPVQGGAATVVTALEQAVGPEGLVLMPSFNLVEGDRSKVWDHARSPATTGYLCEFFRNMPSTFRSNHYSHSVAARGKAAQAFVADHLSLEGMCSPWDLLPWGKTYGDNSPMLRAYRADGQVLMLGVDYHSSTFMHVVEVMCWNQRMARNPASNFNYVNRQYLGAYWDGLGRLSRGKVGQADCRLFSIRDFVDTLLAKLLAEPRQACKWWVD